ncbi:MAG: SRPBCC family protein [Anaerolineae bacterium]
MTTKTSHPMIIALPSEREILVTRVFDAPAKLIFEAHTECEHLRRWIGPRTVTLAKCDNDFRVGGAYRFVYRNPDGYEFAFHGEYREIVPYTRLVTAEVYEMEEYPDMEPAINTMTLEERDNQTTMTLLMLYPTPEARDGAVQSGMEHGMREGYERLDELAEALG